MLASLIAGPQSLKSPGMQRDLPVRKALLVLSILQRFTLPNLVLGLSIASAIGGFRTERIG